MVIHSIVIAGIQPHQNENISLWIPTEYFDWDVLTLMTQRLNTPWYFLPPSLYSFVSRAQCRCQFVQHQHYSERSGGNEVTCNQSSRRNKSKHVLLAYQTYFSLRGKIRVLDSVLNTRFLRWSAFWCSVHRHHTTAGPRVNGNWHQDS